MSARVSVQEIVEALRVPASRRWTLADLAVEPVPDPQIEGALEALFDDDTPCVFDGRYVAEVRLAAAIALAATRALGRSHEPVRVRARRPMRGSVVFDALEREGLPLPGADSPEPMVAAFVTLRELDRLPELDLELVAPIDLGALAAPAPEVIEQAVVPQATTAAPRNATGADVEAYLAALSDPAPAQRAIAAQNLATTPSRDARVVGRLREMLRDDAPCLVSIPIRIGEVRYLAAVALRAELRARGESDVVRVRCLEPATPDDLERARVRSGLPRAPELTLFAELRRGGYLPVVELSWRTP